MTPGGLPAFQILWGLLRCMAPAAGGAASAVTRESLNTRRGRPARPSIRRCGAQQRCSFDRAAGSCVGRRVAHEHHLISAARGGSTCLTPVLPAPAPAPLPVRLPWPPGIPTRCCCAPTCQSSEGRCGVGALARRRGRGRRGGLASPGTACLLLRPLCICRLSGRRCAALLGSVLSFKQQLQPSRM
jgi:hypothetical protein